MYVCVFSHLYAYEYVLNNPFGTFFLILAFFPFLMHTLQKRAFNKLKHDLEPWRNIIVLMDAVLVWEKNFYPAIIFAGVSVLYLALWAMDLSIITLLALTGLMGVLFDALYPTVSRIVFNVEQWSGKHEAQFEHIVSQLCNIKLLIMSWYEYLFANKERKSTMVS